MGLSCPVFFPPVLPTSTNSIGEFSLNEAACVFCFSFFAFSHIPKFHGRIHPERGCVFPGFPKFVCFGACPTFPIHSIHPERGWECETMLNQKQTLQLTWLKQFGGGGSSTLFRGSSGALVFVALHPPTVEAGKPPAASFAHWLKLSGHGPL